MTLVEDRPRHTPQADTEGWLAAFEAALQSRDAAAATINGSSRQNLGIFGLVF